MLSSWLNLMDIKNCLASSKKDDDNIDKVDGTHEAQQVCGPIGDAGEDGQDQQRRTEHQPEDRILDLDLCVPHAPQDVPRRDEAAQDQADTNQRLIEHFTGSFRGVGRLGVALAEPLDQQNRDGHFDHILHAAPEGQVALARQTFAHFDLHLLDRRAVF